MKKTRIFWIYLTLIGIITTLGVMIDYGVARTQMLKANFYNLSIICDPLYPDYCNANQINQIQQLASCLCFFFFLVFSFVNYQKIKNTK